jgi:cytochrome c553
MNSRGIFKRVLRRAGIAVGGLLVLGVIAYAVVYVLAERVLRRTYPVPATALSIPADPVSIAEGQRLATIRGCFAGCHGRQAEGAVLFDQPVLAHIVAPNLTAAAHKYSDAELAAIIRNGVRPDGRSLVVMPSEEFAPMSDEETARIIAFLKSLPPKAGPGPDTFIGPLGRLGFAIGKFKLAAQMIAETVAPPEAADEQAALGRHLARTACGHCHGTNLRGTSNPEFTSPALQIVAAYSPEAFAQLMRTGVALGGRDLRVMSAVARNNLSHLTDAEIAALYSYLHAIPYAGD